jgi:3-oxoacyl-[acyl-carrier-protein] synthase II
MSETWQALLEGHSGVDQITQFDSKLTKVSIAGEVKNFNANNYLESKEIRRLDRVSLFALAAAKQAVWDSKLPDYPPEEVGTIFATGIGGIISNHRTHAQYLAEGDWRIPPYMIPMILPNISASLVAIHFGFQGPCICPVSACAASAEAVGMGYRMIRRSEIRACLVGGCEACITPAVVAGFYNMGVLSKYTGDPKKACKPFDRDRDGFVIAEGSVALVLERLSDVIADGRPYYAEISGFGQTCDAYHLAAPHPLGKGAARAMKLALMESSFTPDQVAYINAHGTATAASDSVETLSIKEALGEYAYKTIVTSTKSMTGHMLGATGALEIAICALAIKTGKIPPTINYSYQDPTCDLNYSPNIASEALVDVAISNSMGFGGHNIALLCNNTEAKGS